MKESDPILATSKLNEMGMCPRRSAGAGLMQQADLTLNPSDQGDWRGPQPMSKRLLPVDLKTQSTTRRIFCDEGSCPSVCIR